jgi:phosphatidate cytidylyltransferase
MPLAAVFVIFAATEVMQLSAAGGAQPRAWVVYCGNVLILLSNWIPVILAKWNLWQLSGEGRLSWQQTMALTAWPLAALTICTLVLLINEMCLFQKPGRAIANMASTAFALIYVGLLMSFLVQLRLAWGVAALVSLIIVVKMGDTGAYLVGRLMGRHKMTPVLSPGKTVEGAVGAIFFACLGAWLSWHFLLPSMNTAGSAPGSGWLWIPYGILIGIAGIFGDLAESLIKRDAGCKDSSTWLPGFGGVLDVLDSLLFAAPVGWAFWMMQSAG